jgi:hypothetical protein
MSFPNNFDFLPLIYGARGSIVVKALCYKPEGYGFETRRGEWFLSIYLILSVALGPGVCSASKIYASILGTLCNTPTSWLESTLHHFWPICLSLNSSAPRFSQNFVLFRQCSSMPVVNFPSWQPAYRFGRSNIGRKYIFAVIVKYQVH